MFKAIFNFYFMVSHTRPFKCPLWSKAGSTGSQILQEWVAKTETTLDRSQSSPDLCVWKNAIFVSECSEMCPVKNGSNMHLVDDGAKELVIICDHVHFSHKNEGTQDSLCSPKGAGLWQKTMWHWKRKWMVNETSRLSICLRCYHSPKELAVKEEAVSTIFPDISLMRKHGL